MQLVNGDLDKLMSVEEVQEMLEEFAEHLVTVVVPGRMEHWTDDEGLHRTPFEKDLKTTVEDEARRYLVQAVSEHARHGNRAGGYR